MAICALCGADVAPIDVIESQEGVTKIFFCSDRHLVEYRERKEKAIEEALKTIEAAKAAEKTPKSAEQPAPAARKPARKRRSPATKG